MGAASAFQSQNSEALRIFRVLTGPGSVGALRRSLARTALGAQEHG